MRETFEGETKNILALYDQLITDVEKEIALARASGLDDSDDYIQELQKKWASYKKSIKDINEELESNAKDTTDSLVDYRVQMIKKEINDEKDAIKKRLSNLKEFYSKQKQMLQDVYDSEKYLEDQKDKRTAISKIEAELAQLQYDDSAAAAKRRIELEEELKKAEKDLNDFERQQALKNAQEELDKQLELQEKELNAQSESLDQQLENAKELYDRALADIKSGSVQLYKDMIKWNQEYGNGIDSTITDAWDKAYIALQKYRQVFGKDYEGFVLPNVTGYTPSGESWNGSGISNGYASGTKYATAGIHRIDEEGSEIILNPLMDLNIECSLTEIKFLTQEQVISSMILLTVENL